MLRAGTDNAEEDGLGAVWSKGCPGTVSDHNGHTVIVKEISASGRDELKWYHGR